MEAPIRKDRERDISRVAVTYVFAIALTTAILNAIAVKRWMLKDSKICRSLNTILLAKLT